MIRGTWASVTALAVGLSIIPALRLSAAPDNGVDAAAAPALNLTQQQQKKLSDMQSASRAQEDQMLGQIGQLRAQLSALYFSYSLDVAAARRLNQELNRVQGQLLDLRLSEQQQLRAVLSRDQFTQLQAMIHRQDGLGDHRPHDHGGHGGPGGFGPDHGHHHPD